MDKNTTIRFNKAQGGIEILFAQGVKLSEGETGALKANGFSWHRKNHYYYARYTEERMAWVRRTFEGVKLPKADEKLVKETAAKKAAEAPKRAPKKVSTADQIAKLEAMVAALLAAQAPAK